MKKGLFITFEGGEGAGKTTIISYIATALKEQGHHVLTTREPGGTPLGEKIRELVLDKDHQVPLSSISELFLFLAARAQHLEQVIKPALDSGKIVICDRFNDSTIAYQGAARGLGIEYVSQLCRLACSGIEPDITILLDVPIEIGLKRTRLAAKENAVVGEVDRIESETFSFHEKVRQTMLERARRNIERTLVIDASRALEEVQEDVAQTLLSRLADRCSRG